MSDMQEELQDTEISLGTGRLLGLFFGLAVVCAVFFGLGFALGRSNGSSSVVQAAATAAPDTSAAIQPAAAHPAADTTAGSNSTAGDPTKDSASREMAFLKTTSKDAPVAAPDAPQAEAPVVTPPHAEAPARQSARRAAHAAKPTAMVQAGFVAQVAAVRRREDAETLVSSLRHKNYPVFIASETPDHLFHVQVGPFGDRKDAQAMKDKLAGDGYNSLVK